MFVIKRLDYIRPHYARLLVHNQHRVIAHRALLLYNGLSGIKLIRIDQNLEEYIYLPLEPSRLYLLPLEVMLFEVFEVYFWQFYLG